MLESDNKSIEKEIRKEIIRFSPLVILIFGVGGFLIGWVMTLNKGIAEICLWFAIALVPLSAIVLLAAIVASFVRLIRPYALAIAAFILAFYGGLALALYPFPWPYS